MSSAPHSPNTTEPPSSPPDSPPPSSPSGSPPPSSPPDSPPGSPVSTSSHSSVETDGERDSRSVRAFSNHVTLQNPLATLIETILYGLAISVIGWAIICYLVQPPVIPLPIHRPLIDLATTLLSLALSGNYTNDLHFLQRQLQSNCTCPLEWIRNRRRHLPENADDLWDNDLWADIPPNLPGRLDGYDEYQMMDIARRCEKVSEDIGALHAQVLNFNLDIIQPAHDDVLNTISALVGHLHQAHRYQLHRKHNSSSRYDGWITEGYRNELGASVIDHWYIEIQVQDEMLGPAVNKKGSKYKRRNPRAFTTQLQQISHRRLRLSSSVAVTSTLSTLATNASLLLDRVRLISDELGQVHHKNNRCRGWLSERDSRKSVLEDIFRVANHKAETAHQAIARIDALRLSLRGFWGTRTYGKKDEDDYLRQFDPKLDHLSLLRNETTLAGDIWQATWTWLGLQTASPASHESLGSFLSEWLPMRHLAKLPELKEQHAAFTELLKREDVRESFLDGVPTHPQMFDLNWAGYYKF
ncbi:hypothetical protein LRP88_02265 [Fusarium phalaenopsidis]